jgi:tRNA A58 N-methylase Trm61
MTDPTTPTGKRLREYLAVGRYPQVVYAADITAIEQEAAAAERERVLEKVAESDSVLASLVRGWLEEDDESTVHITSAHVPPFDTVKKGNRP